MSIMMGVLISVGYFLFNAIVGVFTYRNFVEDAEIEITWTSFPIIILLCILCPSMILLYKTDSFIEPEVTIKAIGNQWYWSYEYSDFGNSGEEVSFNSYLINSSELKPGDFRLIEVDNRLNLPVLTDIRVIVTSNDVIHCFTVPSLGFKIDAVPGRLNQVLVRLERPGLFTGGCSEICGTDHSFMPITVEATSISLFNKFRLIFT